MSQVRIPIAVLSVLLSASAVLLCAAVNERFAHWFVLPVAIVGMLLVPDVLLWADTRRNLLDPRSIVATVMFYGLFVAPLLHVGLDYWMPHVTPPTEWRDWLGWMAILNCLGVAFYRVVQRQALMHLARRRRPIRETRFDRTRLALVLPIAMLVGVLLQVYLYSRFGGIDGYVAAYVDRYLNPQNEFAGTGWLSMIAESFPVLGVLGIATFWRTRQHVPSWVSVGLLLVACATAAILFGGLRGSRGNTTWSVLWGAGIVHLWSRPMSKKLIAAGGAFLLLFMYTYGLYKSAGPEVFNVLTSPSTLRQIENETGRTLAVVLLGDLARSDVQAFLLYRLSAPDSDYRLPLGRTYFGDLALLVPQSLWPTRPPNKMKEGTDIQYGPGTFDSGTRSSRIYGLAGEALLNFGPAAVPLAFGLLGLVVAGTTYALYALPPDDSRRTLMPLAVIVAFWIFASDLDNVLWLVVKHGAIPFLVVWLSSRRIDVLSRGAVVDPDRRARTRHRINAWA